jgi:elongator complex protein 3
LFIHESFASRRHSREGGNPVFRGLDPGSWAGMTKVKSVKFERNILNPQEEIIIQLIQQQAHTRADFRRVVASVYRDSNTSGYDSNIDLRRVYDAMVAAGDLESDENIEKLLITKRMRSLSGVSVITVLTKPFACPGKCIYCPTQEDVPKSYLADEPAVMRAILNEYDARRQVETRLKSLAAQGHPVDKLELIIIGGTFSFLPRDYQEKFVKECFDALNGETSDNLADAKTMNETARSRCVGLTLETRPDFIDEAETKWFRYLGATRVELGVQTVFEDVLLANSRGEKVANTELATHLLRDAGFKICYHLMPNLYGSTLERDMEMFRIVFTDERFKPDYIKIYPCMVIEGTPLYELWKSGKYTSYTDDELKKLLKYVKTIVPYWVRIMRTIRDIPAPNIASGSTLSNMRQIVHAEMVTEGLKCRCIRCREVGIQSTINNQQSTIFTEEYNASRGTEYFLSFESENREILYALLRLRLGKIAIIREVHTYGQQAEVGESGDTQHQGFGRKMIVEAEKIAQKAGFDKIYVISGVGVREYYKKFGYVLEDDYMVKTLDIYPKK